MSDTDSAVTADDDPYMYLRAVSDDGDHEAFVKRRKQSIECIEYPSGERARGRAAGILFVNDLGSCSFVEVERSETPFEANID